MPLQAYREKQQFSGYKSVKSMDESHLLNTIRHSSIKQDRKDECRKELMERWSTNLSTPKKSRPYINDTLVQDLIEELVH